MYGPAEVGPRSPLHVALRLAGLAPQDRLAELLALQLRRLADHLDGRTAAQSQVELLSDL